MPTSAGESAQPALERVKGRPPYLRPRSRSIESSPRSITSRTTSDVTRSTHPARFDNTSRTRSPVGGHRHCAQALRTKPSAKALRGPWVERSVCRTINARHLARREIRQC